MNTLLRIKASKRPHSRIALELTIPAKRCQVDYNAAIEKLSLNLIIPGFRKNKIPRSVMIKQIGLEKIYTVALESLIESVYIEVLDQESIEAIGQPELNKSFDRLLECFNPSSDIIVILETDVLPKPILKKTKELIAIVQPLDPDIFNIDELLEQSRKRLTTSKLVKNRPARSGDISVINFTGSYKDNREIIHSDNVEINLEDHYMLTGLTEGIIGMRINEKKDIECQFSESHVKKDTLGRKAIFNVTLKQLKVRENPTLNDAFAKQVSESLTLLELQSELKIHVKKEIDLHTQFNRQEALVKALIEQLELEIPETLIQQEIYYLIEQTARKLAQKGTDVKRLFTPELVRSLMNTSRVEAEKNLRRSLALKTLAEVEKIVVSANEINEKINQISEIGNNPELLNNHEIRHAVLDDLLQDKLLDWLELNSKVKESNKASNKN
uniref:peptidylprolyl isomerase n=1 Tax=Paulinella chromatophora TaxID=39717 RepID=B1X4K8_PAUCH|nr:trigger factor [Paulinella chromatophora]ACB42877.1 trigger factor [Paulinella chromatophora]